MSEHAMSIAGITDGLGRPVRMEVPMWVFEPWEQQAQANHCQSLEKLRERGGLSAEEAVAILRGEPCRAILPRSEAHRKLANIVNAAHYYRKLGLVSSPKEDTP